MKNKLRVAATSDKNLESLDGGNIMTLHTLRRAVVTLSYVVLMAGSVPAMAQESYPSGSADSGGLGMLADLVFVRPVALVGTVLGAAIFVVSLPFSLPTRSADEAAKTLVGSPFEYTFNRPLGDFDHCGASRHACGD